MKLSSVWVLFAMGALCSCVKGTDEPSEIEDVGEAADEIVSVCPYLDPAFPLPVPVSYPRELMIADLAVIDDPCRTTWTVACGASSGAWTFGELMTRMSGTVPPQVLVAEWLHSFEINRVVNGFPVPARPNMRPAIIDPWLVASGCAAGSPIVGAVACPLDLQKAPFRLLGIVNRVDLSDAGFGATEPGEARFVFGATANGDPLGGPALPFTVIFEYKLPSQRGGAPYNAFDWAKDWHVLSDPAATGAIGSPPYLFALEGILNDITNPGAEPGNPNFGSAIGQVRTNEIVGGPVWKMREYRLKSTGAGINAFHLRLDPLDMTPDDSLNLSAPLDAFLDANSLSTGSTNLAAFTFTVPVAGVQGGEASAPMLWDHTGPTPLAPLERHHFGFATCNGCHFDETNTPFVHLDPRDPGMPTALSGFLSTSPAAGPGGVALAAFNVADPALTGAVFKYNEPFRRACESTRILKGDPTPWTRGNGAH